MGRRTIVLVVALLLAGLSAFAVWQFLRAVEDDVKADIEVVDVFRANQRIEPGVDGATALTFIESSTTNQEFLPPAAIVDQEALNELFVAEALTTGPISEGAIVTTDMIQSVEEVIIPRLSDTIAPGRVAVAISPSQVAAVGGFVRPGDRVNIVATTAVDVGRFLETITDEDLRAFFFGEEEEPAAPEVPVDEEAGITPEEALAAATPQVFDYTETVLQELEVLAVGAFVREAPGEQPGLGPLGGEILVFEVTVEQAERIIWIDKFTDVTLVLLPEGYVPVETEGVTGDDIFSIVERLQRELENLEARSGG
ncbi:MAG: Flp pilus assembly protein CpaB [Acidimicrobiia bacterium]|nr:Flp pilus assembly protein CpaB [Acidimicrobiia bacterium]NNF68946.1 Flp pilus assembly protein CpaB [Acidimicrobiia bacterium]NNK91398.1 Flp pilus assembly protein CpaB [Acidimicrobiia bacterium]